MMSVAPADGRKVPGTVSVKVPGFFLSPARDPGEKSLILKKDAEPGTGRNDPLRKRTNIGGLENPAEGTAGKRDAKRGVARWTDPFGRSGGAGRFRGRREKGCIFFVC